ncbi:DnaJ domain-containing protein [candidate division KSB1 bacterium]
MWLPEKEVEIREWRKRVGINSFRGLKYFADLSRRQKENFFDRANIFIEEINAEIRKRPLRINKSIKEKREYYRFVLGLSGEPKLAEIKKCYRRLVQIHHPDHGGDAELFIKIKEAYDFLMK